MRLQNGLSLGLVSVFLRWLFVFFSFFGANLPLSVPLLWAVDTIHLGNEYEQTETVSSQAPELVIETSAVEVEPGGEVVFSVVHSSDPDGDPLFYFWHGEDGDFTGHNADFTQVEWRAPVITEEGIFTVTGFAGDARGKIAMVETEVTVGSSEPELWPDYVVAATYFGDSGEARSFWVGQGNVRVECAAHNQGDGDSEIATTAVFSLEHNGSIEEIDSTYVMPLDADEVSWEIINLDIHEGFEPGRYALWVKADGRSILTESNEGNNTRTTYFHIDVVPEDRDQDGYFSVASSGDDCDDYECEINPGAFDLCEDGIDQDCSGLDAVCQPHTLYVPSDYPTIQAAVDAADGQDTVLVAPGTYPEDMIWFWGKSVKLRSAQGPRVTVIDGSTKLNVLVILTQGETREAVIDGFTFRSGPREMLLCEHSAPTIINNVFLDGASYAIQCWPDSDPLIMNNIFSRNNHAAIFLRGTDGIVLNNTITGNYGEGIEIYGGHSLVYNNNITSNDGYGVYVASDAWPYVNKNNVWNNGYDETGDGIGDWHYAGCHGVTPYIFVDPRFMNVEIDNFHLRADSPCRNAGLWTYLELVEIDTDMDGEVRLLEGQVDLGADEFSGVCFDYDRDGYEDVVCGGTDCNDGNGAVHPGVPEVCEDGVDQDCSGSDAECAPEDADADGFDETDDCDDGNAFVYPGAVEMCGDGVDQDCSGSDLSCDDVDNDGDGYTENQGDCNDADEVVHPGASEICENGVDENCDGTDPACPDYDQDDDGFEEGVDCDDADASVYPGAAEICGDGVDQDCSGSDLSCDDVDDDGDGYTENQGDCDDGDADSFPGAAEICGDGIDQDCDGIDPECPPVDADEDGFDETIDCNDSNVSVYPGAVEICGDGVDQDCDGVDLSCADVDNDDDGYTENQGDCDDGDVTSFPGAVDVCGDGIDQDCDGIDLECPDYDQDDDGFEEGVDCDDGNASVYPGAAEVCGDGVDQNCDEIDLSCDDVDNDGDGYTENQEDCDDSDAAVYLGAAEICGDAIDQNCDGIDEGCPPSDQDEDGYTEKVDCDDEDASIYPGAAEICEDGIDQDCDGIDAEWYNLTCWCWIGTTMVETTIDENTFDSGPEVILDTVATECIESFLDPMFGKWFADFSSANSWKFSLKITIALLATVLWWLFCRYLGERLVAAVKDRLGLKALKKSEIPGK